MAAPLGNHHNLKWTDEHDVTMRKFYADGRSCSQIAQAINLEHGTFYSRNAVIGRLHRAGIKDGFRRVPKIVKQRSFVAPRPSWAKGVPKRKRAPTPIPPETAALRCAEILPRNVALVDLGTNDCRYPYGDGPFTFCGHPAMEDSSYCVPHFHLCRGIGTGSERAAHKVSATHLEAVA